MADLVDLAQLAVQSALKAGAQWADASVASSRSVGVMLENTSIRECEVVRDSAIGVRAFFNGGVGSATTTLLTEEAARTVGAQAAEMAKVTQPDPAFQCLPEPAPYAEIPGRWDDAIAGMPAAQVVQWCQAGIEEARALAPTVALSGGGDLEYGESALVTSTGIIYKSHGTSVSISFSAVVAEGDDVGAYFDYDVARRMEDFIPAGVATKATEQALKFLGAKHIETARLPLILGPMATGSLCGSAIGAANAESIQRQRSFMIGKEHEKIASDCLSITEDPFVPAGMSSTPVDGEGVPKITRTLIDKGVLTTYLHNSYTANKANVTNTAHAARGKGSPGVGIGASNLSIIPGDRTEAQLIADIEEGLYIDYGGLQPEGATGDISATVDFGFKIENGQLAYPVKTTMIGSNIFEMLENIDAVSSDYREEPGSIVPSLRIRGIQVIGGG
jgi:PmbA protein